MEEGANIYQIAALCKQLFVDCISTPILGEQAWIRSAQGDFNLWCISIKATSSNKSSLDYRLREKPDVREDICDLLRGLLESLQKCQQVFVDTKEAASPLDERPGSSHSRESWEAMSNESGGQASLSEDEFAKPILSENISFVKTILSQLARISIAIRKSGNKYRFEKVDASLKVNEYQMFRQHLTTIILRGFEDDESKELTTAQKIQRASDFDRLTHIQKRLIHANILRRNRIETVQRSRSTNTHQSSPLQQSELVVTMEAREHSTVDSRIEYSIPAHSSIASPPFRVASGKPSRSKVTTAVTATEIGSNLNVKGILAKKTASEATKMTRIGASQTYPDCPVPGPDGSLKCPYCDDLLPPEFSKPKYQDSWRAHVSQDIIPYSCIVDDCETPYEMYTTAEKLLAHMLKEHSITRWTCDYCSYDANDNGPFIQGPRQFRTAQAWISHIELNHGDIIPISQRDTLAELNKQSMIGTLSCPLCSFPTDSVDAKVAIDNHILQHVHEFSLRALPERSIGKIDQGSNLSQRSGLLSHTQLNNTDVAMVRSYYAVSFHELLSKMERVRREYFDEMTVVPDLKYAPPPPQEVIRAELWQTWSDRLREVLDAIDALNLMRRDRMEWDSDIQYMVAEVVKKVNFAAIDLLEGPSYEHAESLSIHTSRAAALCTADIPKPPINSDLTLRDKLLDELEDRLLFSDGSTGKQLRMALIGSSGAGKTTIAGILALRVREVPQEYPVFWIDASSPQSIDLSYAKIARAFDPISNDSLQYTVSPYIVRLFLYILTWTFKREWLVVYDGLQRQTAAYLANENLLPQGPRGCLLFTTTDPTNLALFGPVETIEVPKFDNEPEEIQELNYVIPLRIPFSRNPDFIGREKELRRIDNYFKRNMSTTTTPKFCLTGIEGIGKTQIAIEYVYRHYNNYTAVFWVNAESIMTIHASFIDNIKNIYEEQVKALLSEPKTTRSKLGILLNVDIYDLTFAPHGIDSLEILTRWLHSPGNTKWLLILDNIGLPGPDVFEMFWGLRGGAILVTSQKLSYYYTDTVKIGGLDKKDAVKLLLNSAQSPNPEIAVVVIEYLNSIPLAITLSASYICEKRLTFEQYMSRLERCSNGINSVHELEFTLEIMEQKDEKGMLLYLPRFDPEDYTIGLICASNLQMEAAIAMLDERHGNQTRRASSARNNNNYVLGRIGWHYAVITYYNQGIDGTGATSAISSMLSRYKSIRYGILLGTGDGVPSATNDIRLGDVVVSCRTESSSGVIRYDLGRAINHDQKKSKALPEIPSFITVPTATLNLRGSHTLEKNISKHLSDMLIKCPEMKEKISYRGTENDRLYEADYNHVVGYRNCDMCNPNKLVLRPARATANPSIFFGTIAAGTAELRNGVTRDKLANEQNILCFEMQAADLVEAPSFLVVRGICGYADSHKLQMHRNWQGYAAATATAFAKELLYSLSPSSSSR